MKKNNIPFIIRDDKDFRTEDLKDINIIVTSPGIPFYHNIYKLGKKYDIEVIGDVEYAFRLFRGKIIAVTGTDGKSTTTYFLGEFLKEKNPFVGGNYGEPFIDAVKQKKDTAVLELSSFQIYSTKRFRPNIGVLLNVSTDHLNWHRKSSHYILSKIKMFKNMGKENIAVLNYDIENVRNIPTKAKKYYFSTKILPSQVEGIFCCGNILILNVDKKLLRLDISKFKLKGKHNIQNLMAAVLTAYLYGIPLKNIEEKIPLLKPLPFRLEFAGEKNGVLFYNDSKSTTVQSVMKAVESFSDRPVHLIIGGIYKGGDFSVLNNYSNIKHVYIYGRDRYTLKGMVKNSSISRELSSAVKKAFKNAEKGDIILFSPGCSSFDMFKNYIDRGEKFNQILERLTV
nr:UDP-N-acetylmuramoyl-L-alanine--D-glutamate ligase [Persephonella atlantica]